MQWYMAVKLALQAVFDKKTRNIVLGIIIGIVCLTVLTFSLTSIPSLFLNLPHIAFESKSKQDDEKK